MIATILFALVGCAPQPASIQFDGATPAAVYTMDNIALPVAKVMDAQGKAIEPAPAVTWTVEQADLAKIEGTNLTPTAEGKVTVVATLGTVKQSFMVDVVVPDSVKISGAAEGDTVAVGATASLTGEVINADAALADLKVEWSSSDAAIATIADGVVTGVAPGNVAIVAKGGGQEATINLVVAAADMTAAVPTEGAAPM
jgi:Bacterial Ig-like domain (group 2)